MLPNSYRLRQDWCIRRILKSNNKHHTSDFIVLWDSKRDSHPQFAFIASKKLGSAIKRNRAIRLLRESVRLYIKSNRSIPPYRFVIIAKQPVISQTQGGINDKLHQFFTSIVH